MSISCGEENYMRLCMLIDTGRKAVKVHFDKEFHPEKLKEALEKTYYTKLLALVKKKVIKTEQWKILRDTNVTSSDFDIPLMICLLKNLANLDISNLLPDSSKTDITHDIARIKFYRNSIAHAKRGYLQDEKFLQIWENVCETIRGISEELFQECKSIQDTGLDLLNKDIKLRVEMSFKELKDFKQLYEKLSNEWKTLKKKKGNPIPPKLRVRIKKQLNDWRQDDKKYFVSTKGSAFVLETIQKQSCVAITGSFGMGKTAILHHVALLMYSEGYIVVPVTDAVEIKKYRHSAEKNLFVVDNIFGKCDFDEEELKAWNRCGVEFDDKCKLLVSCQLQVYNAFRYDTSNDIHFHECNLLSDELCLSLNERQSIAEKYGVNIYEIMDYIELYNCFPLLCKHFTKPNSTNKHFTIPITTNAKVFFENPFDVFEVEFEKLQTLDANGKVCALLTLLMFDNHVPEVMITGDIDWNVKVVISNTSKVCNLKTEDLYLTVKNELETLIDTFVVKNKGIYHALNERMFNFLILYFGESMTESLVKFASLSFITKRFQFSDPSMNKDDYHVSLYSDSIKNPISIQFYFNIWDEVGKNAIILSSKTYRNLYVNRLLTDWSKGHLEQVLRNPNACHKYFFEYLNCMDVTELRQLFEKTDMNVGSTALIFYLKYFPDIDQRSIGPAYYCKWLIEHGCRINKADFQGATPIFYAALRFGTHTIEYLLNNGADSNIHTNNGDSPLIVACKRGHSGVTNALLRFGADSNKLTEEGYSSLHVACSDGNTSIVTQLLRYKAEVNTLTEEGYSPLHVACMNGHTSSVTELLQNNAEVNKQDFQGATPIFYAALRLGTHTIEYLLNNGADSNIHTNNGNSPLIVACKRGHSGVTNALLRFGADSNTLTEEGYSSLHVACSNGNTSIVTQLLRYNAEVNKQDFKGCTPLFLSCLYGHSTIAKILLQHEADSEIFTKRGDSPMYVAFLCGHTSIMTELLKHNADVGIKNAEGQIRADSFYSSS